MPGPDVVVAVAGLALAYVVLHQAPEHLPFGQEERDTGADVGGERKEVQVLPDLAVVAGLYLLEVAQVRLELLLRRPRRPVHAGEHLVLLVTPPVGPGDVLELEGPDPARARDVRPAAEVEEVSLTVEGNV